MSPMIDLDDLTSRQQQWLSVIERYAHNWISARELANLAHVNVHQISHFLKVLKAHGKVQYWIKSGIDERGLNVQKGLWKVSA